jgi:hypothetical protein
LANLPSESAYREAAADKAFQFVPFSNSNPYCVLGETVAFR